MAIHNMKTLKRKKYQRAVNKIVREFNKSIKDDWLWNGRYAMSQEIAFFYPYEDHSGAEFNVVLKLKDNKAGHVAYSRFDNYNIDWKIYQWANQCIVEDWKVWDEKPNPNEQARLEGRKPPKW